MGKTKAAAAPTAETEQAAPAAEPVAGEAPTSYRQEVAAYLREQGDKHKLFRSRFYDAANALDQLEDG